MTSPSFQSSEITDLLVAWSNGDKTALDKLMPMVYDELRRAAHRYMNWERDSHTLQTAALVNEAYLRLVDQRRVEWKNRAHFIGVAARLMREILVEHARARQASKRGGAQYMLPLSEADRMIPSFDVNVVALDDALQRLEAVDPQKSQIVDLRYFGGLTIEETAQALGVSTATIKRDWTIARAWLRREISHESGA